MVRYALGMLPDEGLELGIRSIWGDLRSVGVSSNLLDDRGRPHLSLAVCEGLADGFVKRFGGFLRSSEPLAVSLQAAGTFGLDVGVVFLAPSVTTGLTRLHAGFHRVMGGEMEGCSPRYVPGVWVPHFTVAMGLAPDEICRAIGTCAADRLPLEGRLERAAVMEFDEERVVSCREVPLGGE